MSMKMGGVLEVGRKFYGVGVVERIASLRRPLDMRGWYFDQFHANRQGPRIYLRGDVDSVVEERETDPSGRFEELRLRTPFNALVTVNPKAKRTLYSRHKAVGLATFCDSIMLTSGTPILLNVGPLETVEVNIKILPDIERVPKEKRWHFWFASFYGKSVGSGASRDTTLKVAKGKGVNADVIDLGYSSSSSGRHWETYYLIAVRADGMVVSKSVWHGAKRLVSKTVTVYTAEGAKTYVL